MTSAIARRHWEEQTGCLPLTLVVSLALQQLVSSPSALAFCPTALTQKSRHQSRSVGPRSARSNSWRRFATEDTDVLSKPGNSSKLESKIEYENVLMPRPVRTIQQLFHEHEHESNNNNNNIMSQVSWEQVVVPKELKKVRSQDHMTRKDVVIMSGALTLAVIVLGGLIRASGPGAWRYYLAGGLCAAFSHAIPVPVDVVKTRKQVDPNLTNKPFVQAMRWMIENEGVNSLLAGLGPTMMGYLVEGGIKFGVYEATKPILRRLLVTVAGWSSSLAFLNSHVLSLILCGAVSGLAASVVLLPMEALRIRLVAQKGQVGAGWIHKGMQMIKDEGISSMSRGMLAMFYKQVPYTIVKNVSFDLSTRAAYSSLQSRGFAVALHSTKLTITILSAALASFLSCISSQPGDMVLSLINARQGEQRRTHDVMKDILRSERGIRGFFVGIKTRFLHVGIIVTLQLLIYDLIKQFCGIAATGSV